MNIRHVVPRYPCLLWIENDQGVSGVFDISPYLKGEAFAALNNQQEFERIHNGGYFVEWDCGADLSSDTLAAHWVIEPSR